MDGQAVPRGITRISGQSVQTLLRNYGVVIAFVVLFIGLSIGSEAFLSTRNFVNILDQYSPLLIIAAAETAVIIGGNFDLSAGAIYALSGVLAAKAAIVVNPWIGFAIALTIALAIGLLNGLIIAWLRMNSFVATLATGLMFRGLAVALTHGFLVMVPDQRYTVLGRGTIAGIKVNILLMVGFVLLTAFVLARTWLGRHIYAVGGNREAARLSGVRVERIQILTFVWCGFAAGLAGLIASSRVGTGQADAGNLIELTAIAAVVIGGTSIMGGEGAVWRSVLGVLLLALISNGFNMLTVAPYYQDMVKGAIIVLAVALDVWARQGQA